MPEWLASGILSWKGNDFRKEAPRCFGPSAWRRPTFQIFQKRVACYLRMLARSGKPSQDPLTSCYNFNLQETNTRVERTSVQNIIALQEEPPVPRESFSSTASVPLAGAPGAAQTGAASQFAEFMAAWLKPLRPDWRQASSKDAGCSPDARSGG